MNRNLTIFLDLEETLIDDWYSGNWLDTNAKVIDNIIKNFQASGNFSTVELGLMSWAVLVNDVIRFKERFKEAIEQALNLKFNPDWVIPVENWQRACNLTMPFHMDNDDFADFGSKENILFWLRNSMFLPKGKIVLIDDTISNANKIVTPDREIEFINIKERVLLDSMWND